MHLRTIAVLAAVAALLAAVWLLRDEPARGGAEPGAARAFAGVETDRVRAIRIDHAERGTQLRLERDERGAWSMTDPIAYPAESSLCRELLDLVGELQGPRVAADDLASLGLDPPRAELEVEELRGGERVRTRVELGAPALDGRSVYVRSEGRVLAVQRAIDTLLARSDVDFRSQRMLEIDPREPVVEFRRSGRWLPGEDERDLELHALVEPQGWKTLRPARVGLDPLTTDLFLFGVKSLRVADFHDDAPGPLERYGLDDPALRIELTTGADLTWALRFAPLPDGERPGGSRRWLAAREGHPFVWEVAANDVQYLAMPLERLLDYRLVRTRRDAIRSVVLRRGPVGGGGGGVRIERVGSQWRVSGELDAEELERSTAADAGRVEDVLSTLEGTELAAFLSDVELREADAVGSLAVVTESGARWGGWLGPLHTAEGGAEGRLFRRFDEERVALVDASLADLLALEPVELRTLVIQDLSELDQYRIRIRGEGWQRAYTRERKSSAWTPEGVDLEARRFAELVDRVLSLRAVRWLEGEEPPELVDVLEVEIESYAGTDPVVFRLGRDAGGEAAFYTDGRYWAEVGAGLHADLAALRDA